MKRMPEDQHLEYKRELNDTLEKEVVAFLNHRDGGQIHIGIEDSGDLVGLTDPDGDQLKIKDRLRNNIQPSCLGLFDLVLENHEGKGSGENAAATQKTSDATQKSKVKNEVKSKVKTPEQLIDFFRKNPNATLQDAADALGKSISTMEKVSTQLRKEEKIRYTGPQKGGHWEVLEKDEGRMMRGENFRSLLRRGSPANFGRTFRATK